MGLSGRAAPNLPAAAIRGPQGGQAPPGRSVLERWATGESACRPGSVHPLARADGHPSTTAVADSLLRSTREHRAGRPQALARSAPRRARTFLTLLRVGFTKPPQSPAALVVSYTAVSPLPRRPRGAARRSVFCGTIPRVTPGRRYRPPCPMEPGPSSPSRSSARPPGRLTRHIGYCPDDLWSTGDLPSRHRVRYARHSAAHVP